MTHAKIGSAAQSRETRGPETPHDARELVGATRNTWLTSPGDTYNRPVGSTPAHIVAPSPRSINPGTLIERGSVFGVRSE